MSPKARRAADLDAVDAFRSRLAPIIAEGKAVLPALQRLLDDEAEGAGWALDNVAISVATDEMGGMCSIAEALAGVTGRRELRVAS